MPNLNCTSKKKKQETKLNTITELYAFGFYLIKEKTKDF